MKTPILHSAKLLTFAIFFVAAGAANAQLAIPTYNVNEPGRTPFQLFSEFNTQLPNGNKFTTLTAQASNATQRLVVDYFNIEINNLAGPVQTQGYVTLEVRTTTNNTFPVFQMILPVTIVNNTTFGGNTVALFSQPIQMFVNPGQTLTCTALNLSGSSNMNIGVALTGHYVSLQP